MGAESQGEYSFGVKETEPGKFLGKLCDFSESSRLLGEVSGPM